MACFDTSPYLCTYDSGGGKDYTSLATWEADSDNDLTGYTGRVVLDCYDSQAHSGNIAANLAGATNTSATIYRCIRSSPSCTTPWAGKPGTGANFVTSNTGNPFTLGESYARFENFAIKHSFVTATDRATVSISGTYSKCIGVYVYDSVNTDATYLVSAFSCYVTGGLFYKCIADSNENIGFNINAAIGETIAAICCTAIGNGGVGISSPTATGVAIVFSSYAGNNTGGDFSASNWDAPSNYNVSGDASAPGANSTLNKDYWDGGADDAMDADHLLTATVGGGRNPYDDVTATSDFGDFLRNDTAGDALFKYDIAGNLRPTDDVADTTWDVGASQYVATGGFNSKIMVDGAWKAVPSAKIMVDGAWKAIASMKVMVEGAWKSI